MVSSGLLDIEGIRRISADLNAFDDRILERLIIEGKFNFFVAIMLHEEY